MPAYPDTEQYTLTVTKSGYKTFTMTAITADGGAWDAPMIPGTSPPPLPPADDLKRIMVSAILPIVAGLLSIKVAK